MAQSKYLNIVLKNNYILYLECNKLSLNFWFFKLIKSNLCKLDY